VGGRKGGQRHGCHQSAHQPGGNPGAAIRAHPAHRLFVWQPDNSANPYRALLAQADALVVTGESESMLAEAAATTAPLYVYPVAEIRRLNGRLREWCVARIHTSSSREDSSNRLDAALTWMMRRGLLRPRRDMGLLHQALYASGRARPFGDPLVTTPQPPCPRSTRGRTLAQRHTAQ
jgi:uncharacterized protein